MKTLHATIPMKTFLDENKYGDYLAEWEMTTGKIDNIIAHKCANDKEIMILVVRFETN